MEKTLAEQFLENSLKAKDAIDKVAELKKQNKILSDYTEIVSCVNRACASGKVKESFHFDVIHPETIKMLLDNGFGVIHNINWGHNNSSVVVGVKKNKCYTNHSKGMRVDLLKLGVDEAKIPLLERQYDQWGDKSLD